MERRPGTWLGVVGATAACAVVAALVGGGAAARTRAPAAPTSAWPTFGGNLAGDRMSPAAALTPANAAGVVERFFYTTGVRGGGNETYPLEVAGTLLFTASGAHVYAVDAATGAVRWTYTPTPAVVVPTGAPSTNRGVAVLGPRVFVLTPDDRLIALSLATGSALYQVQVADPSTGAFESTAPVAADGVVLVGSAGGDEGVRGFVSAYAAATGKLLWRTYTVPPVGRGWMAGPDVHGGGTVWMPPAVDARTGTVFVATGNPAPDFFGPVRPGADPHTDSILALSLKTGALEWSYAETAHDLWDYDAASPPVLLTLREHGKAIAAVAEAGKDGELYVLSARTGRPLVPPVAFVRVDHPAPAATGTVVYPGTSGGDNYGPIAYDPATGLAYVFAVDGASKVFADGKGELGSHSVQAYGAWTGSVTAVDIATGRRVWTFPTATPITGGGTATAGGLVWFGTEGGQLYALDAATGRVALAVDAGASIGSAPTVYELAGQEYVAVALGGAGSMEAEPFNRPGDAVAVFGLPPAHKPG